MPNGRSAPGKVSTWPTTAPPLPVPTNGLTRAAGSETAAGAAVAAWTGPAVDRLVAIVTASRSDADRLVGRTDRWTCVRKAQDIVVTGGRISKRIDPVKGSQT